MKRRKLQKRVRLRPGREGPQQVVTFGALRARPARGSLQRKAAVVRGGVQGRWVPTTKVRKRRKK